MISSGEFKSDSPRRRTENVWVGDVLIIGGGISGTLLARQLEHAGIEYGLMECAGFGAEQSNHSHGYLHQGYIYLRAESRFVKQLLEAQSYWKEIIAKSGSVPSTSESKICFTNEFNAE